METHFTRCALLWKETTSVSPTTCQEIGREATERPTGGAGCTATIAPQRQTRPAPEACSDRRRETSWHAARSRPEEFGPKGLTRIPEWDKVPISLREGPSMARQIHPTEPAGGLTTIARRRMGRIRYCGPARWSFVAAGRAAEVLADAYHARSRSATIPSRLPMPNRPSLSAPSVAEVRQPCGTDAGLPDETKRAWLKALSPSLPLAPGRHGCAVTSSDHSRPDRMRAGMTHITRRRFFAQAGKMALGFSAVSSPPLAGCAQPAPTPAAPTPVGPSSGGRAPFQIMALRDLAVPSSLQPLLVPDAKDRPLSGSYGQPHVMRRVPHRVCIRRRPALRRRRYATVEST